MKLPEVHAIPAKMVSRENIPEEIEVMPEMIEAGAQVLMNSLPSYGLDCGSLCRLWAEEVIRAALSRRQEKADKLD